MVVRSLCQENVLCSVRLQGASFFVPNCPRLILQFHGSGDAALRRLIRGARLLAGHRCALLQSTTSCSASLTARGLAAGVSRGKRAGLRHGLRGQDTYSEIGSRCFQREAGGSRVRHFFALRLAAGASGGKRASLLHYTCRLGLQHRPGPPRRIPGHSKLCRWSRCSRRSCRHKRRSNMTSSRPWRSRRRA